MEYVFLGLGNPTQYKGTRHNVGKDLIEGLVEQSQSTWKDIAGGRVGVIEICSSLITCIVSNGEMNIIGTVLKNSLVQLESKRLIIIHDDIDLPVGDIKMVYNRGSGGHKGVQSIIDTIGTTEFYRLRIGVGYGKPLHKYVLESIPPDEIETISKNIKKILPCVFQHICAQDLTQAIQECNSA